MLPFLGKLRLIRNEKYCFAFEGKRMSGGISLGNFIFLSPYCAQKETTIAHEYGHVKQSHILGWLYLIIIGLPSILWAGIYRGLGYNNYYVFYTEAWANKIAGLKAYEYYPGYYKIKFIK